MKLNGKIAVVTGASRGIGRAVAIRYAEEGAKVVAVAKNKTLLDSLVKEVASKGSVCSQITADVTSEADCRRIVTNVLKMYGRLDVLVNNAGVLGKRAECISVDLDDWKNVFETNVHAVFVMSKLAVLEMIKQRSGSIINVTSGVVPRPHPKWGAYLPSKFAVEGFTLMLSEELKQIGIRVNMVDPGRTRSDMIHAAYPEIDPSTFKPPEDVTEAFVFLASDEARLITGTRIQIR